MAGRELGRHSNAHETRIHFTGLEPEALLELLQGRQPAVATRGKTKAADVDAHGTSLGLFVGWEVRAAQPADHGVRAGGTH